MAPRKELGGGQGVTVALCNLSSLNVLVREPGAQEGCSLVFSLVHLPLLDSNPIEKNSESKPGCRRKDAKIKMREVCTGKSTPAGGKGTQPAHNVLVRERRGSWMRPGWGACPREAGHLTSQLSYTRLKALGESPHLPCLPVSPPVHALERHPRGIVGIVRR